MLRLAFGEQQAALRYAALELSVGQREAVIESGSKHRDRGAAGLEGSSMGRAVDSGRKSAHDAGAATHECGRKFARYALSVCRCTSRPNDRHARLYGQNLERTAHPEMPWSIFMQVVEVGRVLRIATFDASGYRVLRAAGSVLRPIHSTSACREGVSTRCPTADPARAAPPS